LQRLRLQQEAVGCFAAWAVWLAQSSVAPNPAGTWTVPKYWFANNRRIEIGILA